MPPTAATDVGTVGARDAKDGAGNSDDEASKAEIRAEKAWHAQRSVPVCSDTQCTVPAAWAAEAKHVHRCGRADSNGDSNVAYAGLLPTPVGIGVSSATNAVATNDGVTPVAVDRRGSEPHAPCCPRACTVEQDEDGVWCAHAQLWPGVGAHGEGDSAEAAVEDLRKALEGLIAEFGPR